MSSAGAVLPMLWVSRPWFINTVAVLYCGVTEDSIRPPPDLLITWSISPRMLWREGSRRQEQFLHPLLMNHPRSTTVGVKLITGESEASGDESEGIASKRDRER